MEKPVTLSANTLFHFTSNIESLLGILTNNFHSRYCLENYSVFWPEKIAKKQNRNYSNIARPMTCFCDIPLSSIRNHINVYGKYAIGLSKEWGRKKRISPVMYALNNSISARVIRNGLSCIDNGIEKSNKHFDALYSATPTYKEDKKDKLILNLTDELARIDGELLDLMVFTKIYGGTFVHRNKRYRNVCFYDEREWRHVPKLHHSIPDYISKDVYQDDKQRKEANSKLKKPEYALKFEPSDIRYIIVKKDNEILPMVDSIHEIKGHKYTSEDLKLLTTRIISMEQVLQDF
jgi:hypothetical protein